MLEWRCVMRDNEDQFLDLEGLEELLDIFGINGGMKNV